MKVLINNTRTQAIVERDGQIPLELNSDGDVMELVAIFVQPLETWDGSFKSAAQLVASSQETTSFDLNSLNQKESA